MAHALDRVGLLEIAVSLQQVRYGGGRPGIPAPEFPSLLILHMYPLSVTGLPMPWSRALVAVA